MVFEGILNREPTPAGQTNPALPPDVDRILAKALEKDRTAYQTATDLKTDMIRLKRDLESGQSHAAGITDSRGRHANQEVDCRPLLRKPRRSEGGRVLRDGITEDIITELSKIRSLNIFSRPTVLAYRDKQVTPAQLDSS